MQSDKVLRKPFLKVKHTHDLLFKAQAAIIMIIKCEFEISGAQLEFSRQHRQN